MTGLLRKTTTVPRQAKKQKVAKLPPATLLFLLGFVSALLLFASPLLARKTEVDELKATLQQTRNEIQELQTRVAALATLEQRLRELEKAYAAIKWPPDPDVEGIAWIEGVLARHGWTVKSMDVSAAAPLPNGLKEAVVIVDGKVPSGLALITAIEDLLAARVSLRKVSVEAQPDRTLQAKLHISVFAPQEDSRP